MLSSEVRDKLGETDILLPNKRLPRLLVSPGGEGPVEITLLHLHGNRRHCRQHTSLGTNNVHTRNRHI